MDIIWKEKKRWVLGAIPWTFTTYSLTEDKLIIDSGVFTSKQEEIMLYRVLDLTLTRNIIQKMFNLGTILVKSGDQTCPNLYIKNIPDSMEVKEQLSVLVEQAKDKKRVFTREVIDSENIHNWI